MKHKFFVSREFCIAALILLCATLPVMGASLLFNPVTTIEKVSEKGGQERPIDRQFELLGERLQALEKQGDGRNDLEKTSTELKVVKGRVSGENKDSFWQRKTSVLSDLQQVFSETIRLREQVRSLLKEHREIIEQYRADPHFKDIRPPAKVTPTYEDLQTAARRASDLKEKIEGYEREMRKLTSDHEKRTKALADIAKELDENKQQRDKLERDGAVRDDLKAFDRNQRMELLDDQLRLARAKKDLAQLRCDESVEHLGVIETKLMIARKRVTVLDAVYAKMKRQVVINASQIRQAEEQLENDRHEFFTQRDVLQNDFRGVLAQIEDWRYQVESMVEGFKIPPPDAEALRFWKIEKDRFKSREDWEHLTSAGFLYARVGLYESKHVLLEARVEEAKFQLQRSERQVDVLKTWYKMTQRAIRLNVGEELDRETKKYEAELSQLKVELAGLIERRDKTIDLLYRLNVSRDAIRALMSQFRQKKDLFSDDEHVRYTNVLNRLIDTDEEIRQRVDVTTKLMESYAKSMALVQEMIKAITDIVAELSAKSFWIRSEQSIELRDLKSFWPDVRRFLYDLKRMLVVSVSKFSFTALFERIARYFQQPPLWHLIVLFLVLFCFVLSYCYVPRMRRWLLQHESRYWVTSRIWYVLALFLDFGHRHILTLFPWFLLCAAVVLNAVPSVFSVFFYLASIPYLIYIAVSFFAFLVYTNSDRGVCVVSRSFQDRFLWIVPFLTYATIAIFFFRRAFMLCNYLDSQIPEILLAVNFILLQAALIGLIWSKDSLIGSSHVLGIFSRSSPFGKWLEEHIERYYYLFLLAFFAIIVMSNPYVGYGRQVFYVLTRLVITALLIPLIMWLYERIKRVSSDFFFYYPDGLIVKERFAGGKTWYGLFIVISFIVFVVFAFFVVARVWDQGVIWRDISRGLNFPFSHSADIDPLTDKPIPITILSVIKMIMYVLGGISIVYVLNRFVLRRIFDPLLIGAGVQSTIMTLGRYVIVVLAFMIGLQSVGLGSMATKLIVVIAGVSYIIKEPIADFFSYFIILVQRPIKIGDYIELEDPDIAGVVRHITPRSTIVRCKNSYTYVVPNSMIVTKVIQNWHFSRSFVAIEDVEVIVSFSDNPETVKKLLTEVASETASLLKNPAPIIWLTDFADGGYKFILRGFISTDRMMDRWEIESQLRLAIVKKLRGENITIVTSIRVIALQGDAGK